MALGVGEVEPDFDIAGGIRCQDTSVSQIVSKAETELGADGLINPHGKCDTIPGI